MEIAFAGNGKMLLAAACGDMNCLILDCSLGLSAAGLLNGCSG